MIATNAHGQPLRSRLAGTAHCPRCGSWIALHAEADAWGDDGNVTAWRPAYGLCCELAMVVTPDGVPEVTDLRDDAPVEVA